MAPMPEVHLPQLDDEEDKEPEPAEAPVASPPAVGLKSPTRSRPHSLLRIALELTLIATGVFLGLAGEQWRESAHHRELARESLHRLRAEIVTNRKTVQGVKDYHVEMRKRIEDYLAADEPARRTLNVRLQGVQPAFFERTAWDLALATQSLTYIESDLAFALSRVYGVQQQYTELSRGVLQAMYLRNPREDLVGFLEAVDTYYGDVVLMEPKLLEMYDELLPQIDRALGDRSRKE